MFRKPKKFHRMYYATVIFCSIFFVFFHFGSRNISRQKDQNNRLFTETYIRLYLNIACLFFLVIHFLCKKKNRETKHVFDFGSCFPFFMVTKGN